MPRRERFATLRVVCAIALVASIIAVNLAFDAHNDVAMFMSILSAFASMGGVLHATRQLGQHELIMGDHWTPRDHTNPFTGLPMVDSTYDVQGNLYGTRSSETHGRSD